MKVVKQISMKKVNRILPATLVVSFIFGFSTLPKEKLQWISLQDAESKLRTQKKPVLIDLYTDWCGWCKVMDKKTYAHPEVAKYINEKFYAIKINAETKQTLMWNGKEFPYNTSARVNNYALYLTQGQLAFPTTVIIPADGSAPQAIPGFLESKDMELLLKYFGEGYYGKVGFNEYQKKFLHSWK